MSKATDVGIVKPAEVYDFDFITRALGLIPVPAESDHCALSPGAITHIEPDQFGQYIFHLHGGGKVCLNAEEMVRFEATIRRREQEAKEARREQMREQIITQHEIIRDLNNLEMSKVQPGAMGQMIINPAERKRRI